MNKRKMDITNVDFVLGKNIPVDALNKHNMFITEKWSVKCFLGYQEESQPRKLIYDVPSVATPYPDSRKLSRFMTLSKGSIHKSGFLSDDVRYKVVRKHQLVFPSIGNSRFGVVSRVDGKEHAKLTRAVFGGTSEEIQMVAVLFARLTGRGKGFFSQPRITISNKRDNMCDVNGSVIPAKFPYLTFNNSEHRWSHVSLVGFYRVLDLCCSCDGEGSMRQNMLDKGVSAKLLDQLIGNATESSWS